MIEIHNEHILADLFGHWPDFHDGEISRVRIDTTGYQNPVVEIDFEVAEMSDEVDERGYFRDRQRVKTTLRFENVASMRLEGLYNQNSMGELRLMAAGPHDYDEVLGASDPHARRLHRVEWNSHIGMAGSFVCDGIVVVNAEPYVRLPNER
jgi:hypothetical protein